MTRLWLSAAVVLPLLTPTCDERTWFGPAWLVLKSGLTLSVEAHRIDGRLLLVRREGELYSLRTSEVAEIVETTEPVIPPRPDEVRVYAPVRVPSAGSRPSDEAYWRGRVRPLKRRLAGLEARREAAVARLREADRELRRARIVGRSRDVSSRVSARRRAVRELARQDEALAALRAELSQLREQARRAGAYPGWTR